MKRWFCMLAMLCCLVSLCVLPASAESVATRIDYYATVNIDGDCLVTMTVNLHLDTAYPGLTFPVPGNAEKITLNGSSVATEAAGDHINVSLERGIGSGAGDFPLQIAYTIPNTVTLDLEQIKLDLDARNKLKLELPMLCGFSLPVQGLNYTITLPGEITASTEFFSTYRQNGIASDLVNNISGSMITGASKTGFNDHESLTMTMAATTEMFPGVSTYLRTGNPEVVPMGIFAGLALLYWIFFLRTLPPRRDRSTQAPEGISAGELGCRLTLSGGDLTMMVFSWAQMGYLLIQLDGRNRVLLHKRMDMGNERSLFEVRLFKLLFGDRRVIDCGSSHYAKLRGKTARMVPGEKTLCKSSSGNVKVFRILCCISQVFCGICVAMNMTVILALQILLSLIFGALGIITAWQIQNIAYTVFLREKRKAWIGAACMLLWVILGIISHQVWIPLGAVVGQFVMGFFAAYGGRRSDLNRGDMSLILGLRHYLKQIPEGEVPRILRTDPDFFFRMAPYAMAMGVLKPFAAVFGKRKLDQCPFLVTKVHSKRRAEEWALMMVQAADMMDARYRQMEAEKWLPVRLR